MTTELIVPGAGLALAGLAIAFDVRNAAQWFQLFNFQYRNSNVSLRTMKFIGATLATFGSIGVAIGLAT